MKFSMTSVERCERWEILHTYMICINYDASQLKPIRKKEKAMKKIAPFILSAVYITLKKEDDLWA